MWVRCNGEAPEDCGPFEVFDDLRKTLFRPRKRKQGHAVEVEDGGLLGFAALKDLAVSLEEDGQAEVRLDIQDLWVVPKRATRHADIGGVYGVGLESEDEDSEDEDLEQAGEVASSSSSDLRNSSAVPSTSSNPAAQVVFGYDVDEAVLKAMESGWLHEWTKVEFKAISRKHGLGVSVGKGELMERVRCTSRGCTSCREFVISCATGDGTFGWSNTASLDLIEKSIALVHVELCRV